LSFDAHCVENGGHSKKDSQGQGNDLPSGFLGAGAERDMSVKEVNMNAPRAAYCNQKIQRISGVKQQPTWQRGAVGSDNGPSRAVTALLPKRDKTPISYKIPVVTCFRRKKKPREKDDCPHSRKRKVKVAINARRATPLRGTFSENSAMLAADICG